jgi:beta-phosphoglucomutase
MAADLQAALFDLDGVVVFTDRYHYLAWKELADRHGWAFSEEVNHGCRGVPRMESLEVILKHNRVQLPESEKQELADWKNLRYVEFLAKMSPDDLYPGVISFLVALRDGGMKVGLCSSSRNAQRVLDGLGIAHLFDAVVTGADILRAKPDPEIFLMGAERLGVEPRKCVVFEDAPSGVEAALAAGMQCIGVGPAELLSRAPLTILEYAELDPLTLGKRTSKEPMPSAAASAAP